MSKKQIEVTQFKEEENFDVFASTLREIMESGPDNRGPAAKAIMSAFQVYYDMIGGAAAKAKKHTR